MQQMFNNCCMGVFCLLCLKILARIAENLQRLKKCILIEYNHQININRPVVNETRCETKSGKR